MHLYPWNLLLVFLPISHTQIHLKHFTFMCPIHFAPTSPLLFICRAEFVLLQCLVSHKPVWINVKGNVPWSLPGNKIPSNRRKVPYPGQNKRSSTKVIWPYHHPPCPPGGYPGGSGRWNSSAAWVSRPVGGSSQPETHTTISADCEMWQQPDARSHPS